MRSVSGLRYQRPVRWYNPCYYQSPWNRAVNDLRAARAAQPKALPTNMEWDTLVGLRQQKDQAWESLITAEKDEKPHFRTLYNEAKRQLEREQATVVKDMHRRRRHGIHY